MFYILLFYKVHKRNTKKHKQMDFTKLCLPKHIKKQIDADSNEIQICTRFPPEPSGGSMHLGHLFAARLNQSVATVYNGKFLVRFDDTNPNSECTEYEQAILEDLISYGFDMTNLSHTSDSFEFLIEKATKLINLGWAYVDDSTHEEIAEQRKQLIGSQCRSLSIKDNLEKWNKMIDGTITNMSLRLKAFPDSKNGAMRDPILYRSISTHHHRTGTKFKIYPTYDFACPVLDSVDNVTHVFRSKEYVERDDQMKFILTKLNMRIPKVITYGRLNIEGSELSKRKIKQGIENGTYIGWNDKKLFTCKGMKNRGISLEGINKFLDDVGFPESSIIIQQQKIFTINTKVIDKSAHRIMAIALNDTTILNLHISEQIIKSIANFFGNKNLGERICTLSPKIIVSKKEMSDFQNLEELTLIHFGNVIFEQPDTLNPNFQGNPTTTSKKILWLNPSFVQSVILEMLDNTQIHFLTESHISNINPGEYVQLNKIGYFYKKLDSCGQTVLVQI